MGTWNMGIKKFPEICSANFWGKEEKPEQLFFWALSSPRMRGSRSNHKINANTLDSHSYARSRKAMTAFPPSLKATERQSAGMTEKVPSVIPVKTGIQSECEININALDSRLRGNDREEKRNDDWIPAYPPSLKATERQNAGMIE